MPTLKVVQSISNSFDDTVMLFTFLNFFPGEGAMLCHL